MWANTYMHTQSHKLKVNTHMNLSSRSEYGVLYTGKHFLHVHVLLISRIKCNVDRWISLFFLTT